MAPSRAFRRYCQIHTPWQARLATVSTMLRPKPKRLPMRASASPHAPVTPQYIALLPVLNDRLDGLDRFREQPEIAVIAAIPAAGERPPAAVFDNRQPKEYAERRNESGRRDGAEPDQRNQAEAGLDEGRNQLPAQPLGRLHHLAHAVVDLADQLAGALPLVPFHRHAQNLFQRAAAQAGEEGIADPRRKEIV